MTYILDASAIYKGVKDNVSKLALIEGMTINLAEYEIGNILWKEHLLHKRLTYSEAIDILNIAASACENMDIFETRDSYNEILEIASKYHISYYDASYVFAAKSTDSVLVTQDERLIGKVKTLINTKKIEEL